MRKILIVALAALTALGLVSVAAAQDDGAELTAKTSPAKAGTKRKPKPTALTIDVKNGDFSRTASRIEIWLPKTLKLSTKGIKKCNLTRLSLEGPSACSKATQVGKGDAQARAGVSRNGVYAANPGQLPFDVVAYAADPKTGDSFTRNADLAFRIASGDIVGLAPARLSRASGKYGSKLTIEIPEEPAQQYPQGQFNGLESLNAKLFKKVGKNSLFKSTGCKKRKNPFKVALTFVANPDPAKAGKLEDTYEGRCRK